MTARTHANTGPATEPTTRFTQPLMLAGVYALCAVAIVWPLVLVDVPALVDYPNHLARMHIIGNYDASPALQRNYTIDWSVVPNLAMDLIVPLLAPVFGLQLAGKIFLALTVCLPVAGVMALRHVVHGHIGIWPVAAILFVYNYAWIWGLLNYLFGLGLSLLAFAGWIASAKLARPLRLGLFTAAAVVLFFCHFFAFAVYGLLVLGFETWLYWAQTQHAKQEHATSPRLNFLWSMGQFAAPALLLLLVPTWDGVKVTAYGSLGHKIVAAASPLLSYFTVQDVIALLLVASLTLWLFLSRRLTITPMLRWPIALLLMVAVLMPHSVQSNWLTDIRLPPVLALILVAAATWKAPSQRWIVACVFVVALAWVGRTVEIVNTWRAFDLQYAEFREVAKAIPRGARVLTVQSAAPDDSPAVARPNFMSPYYHMVSLAVIERDVFTPTQFTNRAAQPVQAAPQVKDIDAPFARPITPEMLAAGIDPERSSEMLAMAKSRNTPAFWKDWPKTFEYVVFVNWGRHTNPAPRHLRSVARGSFFEILEIIPASRSDS